MERIQIFAHTPASPADGTYVKFLQAFKMDNGNVELCIRNSEGVQNSIEITTDEAMNLSLSLGASKFPYEVVAERGR